MTLNTTFILENLEITGMYKKGSIMISCVRLIDGMALLPL